MKWDEAALKELEKVPKFVRERAKQSVERKVKEKGKDSVSLEDVREHFEEYISFILTDEKAKPSTRIAIVRCERISETCPATACLLSWQARKVHFKEYEENAKLVAAFTCGGCPGRRISRLLDSLMRSVKVDVVHLASCMVSDSYAGGLVCPHRGAIVKMIKRKGIKVVEGTHH
jgi:predicted metal-binding protein